MVAVAMAAGLADHVWTLEEWLAVTPRETLDVLASFQYTVISELLRRAQKSAEEIYARSVIISGGVACNTGLRRAAEAAKLPYPVFFPSAGLSTDNAAMIAAAAYSRFRNGIIADVTLNADPSLAIA
jgi:N6-L-threonylcarbamoyladenine synthase